MDNSLKIPEASIKRIFEAIARIVSDRENVKVVVVEVKKNQDSAA